MIVAALVLVVASAFTVSMQWNIAKDDVTVSFELPEEGTKGTFSGLKASIDFDRTSLSNAKFSASIDVKTLNTGDKQKDNHLLSADFFNAEKYPAISFISNSVKVTDIGFLATGNLTIKDSTKTIEIPFAFSEDAEGSGTFKGTMTIIPGDYGVMKKSKSGKDKVVVTLEIPVKK